MAGNNSIRALRALLITETADRKAKSPVERVHVGTRRAEAEAAGTSRGNSRAPDGAETANTAETAIAVVAGTSH